MNVQTGAFIHGRIYNVHKVLHMDAHTRMHTYTNAHVTVFMENYTQIGFVRVSCIIPFLNISHADRFNVQTDEDAMCVVDYQSLSKQIN